MKLRLTGDSDKCIPYEQLARWLCVMLQHELSRCGNDGKRVIFSISESVEIACSISLRDAEAEIVHSDYIVAKRHVMPTTHFIAVGKEGDGLNNCVRFYMVMFRDKSQKFIDFFYPGQFLGTTNDEEGDTDMVVKYIPYSAFMAKISAPKYMKNNDRNNAILKYYRNDIETELLRNRILADTEKIFTLGSL